MDGTCNTHRGKRGAYRALVGNLDGTRPLGRHRLRWENNNVDLQVAGW